MLKNGELRLTHVVHWNDITQKYIPLVNEKSRNFDNLEHSITASPECSLHLLLIDIFSIRKACREERRR